MFKVFFTELYIVGKRSFNTILPKVTRMSLNIEHRALKSPTLEQPFAVLSHIYQNNTHVLNFLKTHIAQINCCDIFPIGHCMLKIGTY